MVRNLPLLLLLYSGLVIGAELPPYAPGEILIKYREGANNAVIHTATSVARIERLPGLRWQHLHLPPDLTVEQALAHYRQQPEVEYAEPNYYAYKAETLPDDPSYSLQWGLQNMQAERAWDEAQGSNDTVIAVVDTGIFYDHPDLAANMWINPDETAEDGLDNDGNGIIDDIYGVNYNGTLFNGKVKDDDTADWHGTHVAGIAGAVGNNGRGIAGVNWQVRLMAVKVLHGDNGAGTTADIIKGIDYAIAKDAHVINLSLTIPGYSTALAEALGRADTEGKLTVSAAGNANTNNDFTPYSPAAIRTPNNIAVAAINSSDGKANYSNYGRLTVDLGAPGGESSPTTSGIYSTIGTLSSSDFDNYNYLAGTSMATPHVSGLAALILAKTVAEGLELTHHQVKARILNGARKLPALDGITISGGTADAYASLTVEDKPAVFRVVPSSAYAGDTLTITGVNFGSATGTVNVGTLEFPVPTAWSDGAVQVTVPTELPTSYGRLQVNGEGNGFFVRRLNRLPTATLTVDSASGSAPLTVSLTASASDTDGSIASYEWDLGDGVFAQDTGTVNTLQHTYTNAGDYTLRVRVSDNDGGTATATALLTVSSTGGDSRCFIATAAYGSPMEMEVMTLRRFRDRYLLDNSVGSKFVELYYAISPPVADAIRERGWARDAVRTLLRPLIGVTGWLMKDAQAGSNKPQSPQKQTAEAIPGEYLVGFIADTGEAKARAIVEQEGGVLREYNPAGTYGVVLFPTTHAREDITQRLLSHEAVRYAEPNFIAHKPEQPQ